VFGAFLLWRSVLLTLLKVRDLFRVGLDLVNFFTVRYLVSYRCFVVYFGLKEEAI
jgi:hypothetical protein